MPIFDMSFFIWKILQQTRYQSHVKKNNATTIKRLVDIVIPWFWNYVLFIALLEYLNYVMRTALNYYYNFFIFIIIEEKLAF